MSNKQVDARKEILKGVFYGFLIVLAIIMCVYLAQSDHTPPFSEREEARRTQALEGAQWSTPIKPGIPGEKYIERKKNESYSEYRNRAYNEMAELQNMGCIVSEPSEVLDEKTKKKSFVIHYVMGKNASNP